MDLYLSFEINGSCLPFCFKNIFDSAQIYGGKYSLRCLQSFVWLLAKIHFYHLLRSISSLIKIAANIGWVSWMRPARA